MAIVTYEKLVLMSAGNLLKLAKARGIPLKGTRDKQKILKSILCSMEVSHILKGGY
jgi:hypothetical protein